MPRRNFSYLFINLNPILRYLLLFLLLITIFLIWFFTFYAQLIDKKNELNIEITNLKQKENLLFNVKKEINEAYIEIQNINNQIDSILGSYFSENLEDYTNLLMQNAKIAGLVITNCSSQEQTSKQFYDKNIINFSFKGSFNQIIEFFKALALSKHWMKFKKINISNVLDNQIQVDGIYKFYIPKKGDRWPKEELFIQ